MKKYDFDKIRKDYEAKMNSVSDVKVPLERVIHYAFISREWVGNLIGICAGLQEEMVELDETIQK